MPTPPQLIDVARSHLAAGRLAEAEAACRDILRDILGDDAACAPALHVQALAEAGLGRLPEGAGLLERAVQLAPESFAARNDLGAMLILLGRPLEGETQLRAALALAPDSADAQVNLGNALHAQGRVEAAEAEYRSALGREPRHGRGLLSLGNLLGQMRRPAEALPFLSSAVALAPGAAAAHQFLGNALRDLGRTDEAAASYRRALALDPGNADSNENLGNMLKAHGRYAEARDYFRASGSPLARAQALDCELRLGRHADFFSWLETGAADEATNLHSASLSAYAAFHLDRPDPHRFCPAPLTQVRITDRYTAAADAPFLAELIRAAGQMDAIWEPRGVATKRGFQTGGNLFAHAHTNATLARLQRDLGEELLRYRAALAPASLALATRWPGTIRLHGWFVRLLEGGHQDFHNHPYGWLSGCLYLQMPSNAAPGEGAIEFGLEGGEFPRLSDRPSPTRLHQPRPGELVLFPSSLYHRTIPFRSDEERLCIAFDLLPA